MIIMDEYDRLVYLQKEIIFSIAEFQKHKDEQNLADIYKQGTELMTYLVYDFDVHTSKSSVTYELVRDYFKSKFDGIDFLSKQALIDNARIIVSIGIIRNLIIKYQAPFSAKAMPIFNDFAKKYRDYIIQN